MPTIQVIGRQEDPKAALIRNVGKDVAESQERKLRMDLYGLQIKQSVQNAKDDAEKESYQRIKQFHDYFTQLLDRTDAETALAIAAKSYPNEAAPYLQGFGAHNETLSKIKSGPVDQNPMDAAMAEVINRKLNRGGAGLTAGPSKRAMINVSSDGVPGTSSMEGPMQGQQRISTLDGTSQDMLLPSITHKGVTIVDPVDTETESYIKAMGAKRADRAAGREAALGKFESGLDLFYQAKDAMGGSTGETGLEALTKSTGGRVGAFFNKDMQAVSAWDKARNPLAASMVRELSGAQANQLEIAGIMSSIPDLSYSDAVNDALISFWQAQFGKYGDAPKASYRQQQEIKKSITAAGKAISEYIAMGKAELKAGRMTPAEFESGLADVTAAFSE